MVASWELLKQNQVLAAILHTDNTTIGWSFGLRNLIVPGPPIVPLCGMPYDHARNEAAKLCLHGKQEWLFFLDSDVIPPRDAVLRLMSHRKPIISGLYARRSHPVALPVMMKGGKWITQYRPGSVLSVELVGAGCFLIHRSVLEHFAKHPDPRRPGKPWFDWRVDLQGLNIFPPDECASEDYSFCIRARREFNYEVLVDTSIVCRHVGYGESTPGSFQPHQAIPVT